jgi:hypothetical protein
VGSVRGGRRCPASEGASQPSLKHALREQNPQQGVNNTTAPQPLVNRMPVPQEYAGAARAEVLAAEGPTYAWLWANIVNM